MIELEDQPWFPSLLRNFQTAHIGYVASRFKLYDPFIAELVTITSAPRPLIDLCSGSGEPALTVFKRTACFTHLTLTDLFPPASFTDTDRIVYERRSVDARTIALRPDTWYTLFNAFHHFSDAEKAELVRRLRNESGGAFIVEVLEPTAACFLKVIVATTIGTVVLAPFVKPFSIQRLFFTWILPVNVFTITWDGLVSVLRSRSVRHYQHLLRQDDHRVRVTRIPHRWFPLVLIRIAPP